MPTATLRDIDARVRRAIDELRHQWTDTREVWRDDQAAKFQREHLNPIAPMASRLADELGQLIEAMEKANRELADDVTSSDASGNL